MPLFSLLQKSIKFNATSSAFYLALLFSFAILPTATFAEENIEVIVESSYIDIHTGPGRGYPIFYSIEKGETLSLIKMKTDWIKVVTSKGKEGWVHRRELEKTVGVNNEIIDLGIPDKTDYAQRRWELGLGFGEFGNVESLGIYGGYRLTENLSAELHFGQATGRFSNSQFYYWSLVHQPFPEWRISPYFTLGNGEVNIKPNNNLSQSQDRQDTFFLVGAGAYLYYSHRFMVRVDYNDFTTLPDRDENEHIREWKIGLSAFF